MKYSVITFGCRVNQADSLGFEESLLARGATVAPPEDADVVIVNTVWHKLYEDSEDYFCRAPGFVSSAGEWFVENRLTVADLKCFLWVRWLKSGALDHIPSDIVDRHAPLLAKHFDRVRSQPGIAAYYAARGK